MEACLRTTIPALKGFEHVNRYWDARVRTPAAKILPGECYVSKSGEMIVTVLCSCLCACIRDKKIGVGGMNHFMLPLQADRADRTATNSELAYGYWAMEFLINEIFKLGGHKSDLEIKLIGGANVFPDLAEVDLGERNIDFVTRFIELDGFKITSRDLGKNYPRKVSYFADTGVLKVKRLRTLANDTLECREREYFSAMATSYYLNDVELF